MRTPQPTVPGNEGIVGIPLLFEAASKPLPIQRFGNA
jgi:hypothetical protein